jgi:catalase
LYEKVLKEPERAELVDNIASHLCNAQEFIQQRAVRNFSQADPEYGRRIQERLNFYKAEKKKVNFMEWLE